MTTVGFSWSSAQSLRPSPLSFGNFQRFLAWAVVDLEYLCLVDDLKKGQQKQPELFVKKVYKQAGLNSYLTAI